MVALQANMADILEAGARVLEEEPERNLAPPVWERGVSYALLESFISSYGIPSNFTTSQVVEEVIKPATEGARCSAWEAVFVSGASIGAGTLLGTSTTMVSHSWSNSFVDLAAVLRRQDEAAEKEHFFFLDIFCMDQHSIAECTATRHLTLLQELKMSVSSPGRMIMIMEPWEEPRPLSRCWCLYEVYLASITKTRVDMAFLDSSEREISQALVSNMNLARDIAKLADVRKAKATMEEDREMILAAIEQEIGLDGFAELIRSKLQESLYLATLGPLCFPSGSSRSRVTSSSETEPSQRLQGRSAMSLPLRPNSLSSPLAVPASEARSVVSMPHSWPLARPADRAVGALNLDSPASMEMGLM